ncbi:MAG: hypothetical protein ABEL76_07410 [Bradymonadaceae bacterium]
MKLKNLIDRIQEKLDDLEGNREDYEQELELKKYQLEQIEGAIDAIEEIEQERAD